MSESRPGPDVRRKQILEGAIEVFGKKGYYGASTAGIAEAAGLSTRMVFFYFENKKNLFRKVLELCASELTDSLTRGMPPPDDIGTFFKMTTRNFVTFLKENAPKVKIILQSLDALDDQDIQNDLRKIMDDLHKYIYSFLQHAREQGKIHQDVILETASLFIMGLTISVSYAEFLELPWFGPEGEYTFNIGDYFIDSITSRQN